MSLALVGFPDTGPAWQHQAAQTHGPRKRAVRHPLRLDASPPEFEPEPPIPVQIGASRGHVAMSVSLMPG